MIYGNPQFGPFFFIVLCVILFSLRAVKRRRLLMERFIEGQLLRHMALGFSRNRRIMKLTLFSFALLLILFSLMRPQWGFQWEEVKKSGLDIIVAMDTSKSMLAQDVKPNRLLRSKLAVRDMIKKLRGDRIGLIAFSGGAFLQCPLTQDYSGFLLTLDDLDTTIIPRGGTAIGSALREAMKVFQGPEKKYKILVIITDGEDHEGGAVKIAEQAKDLGIRIFTIGVGTEKGELIPVAGKNGKRRYIKDRDGNVVRSRLNEEILKKIALTTGGAYVRASGAEFGLNAVYDKKISKLEKRDIEAKMKKRYRERFQIFLAAAFILLFLEPLVSERTFVR